MALDLIITLIAILFIKSNNYLGEISEFNPSFISISIYFLLFTFLFYKSRAAALALYLTSFYIVGQLSIISGYSIRSLLAIYYVYLLIINIKRIRFKNIIFILILITVYYFIGILRTYQLHEYGLINRAFLLINIWSSSLIIGFLSIGSIKEFKILLKYISIFALCFIFSFPLDYILVIYNYFINCHPIFLSLGSINRSEIAYIVLLGYAYSLYMYLIANINKFILLAITNALIIIFCGSKSPLILFFLVTIFISFYSSLKNKIFTLSILSIILLLLYINCSFYNNYFNFSNISITHSVNTRVDLISDSVSQIKSRYIFDAPFWFGTGFGSSVTQIFRENIVVFKAASGNFFIDAFVETGLVGLIIIILLTSPIILLIFKNIRHRTILICISSILLIKATFASEYYNDVLILVMIGIYLRLIIPSFRIFVNNLLRTSL